MTDPEVQPEESDILENKFNPPKQEEFIKARQRVWLCFLVGSNWEKQGGLRERLIFNMQYPGNRGPLVRKLSDVKADY